MHRRTALLTGISGFVGTWLAGELQARGWRIAGLVPPEETIDREIRILQKSELVEGDLLNPASLTAALGQVKPDAVIHMAAESAPSRSARLPMHFFRVNVLGTQNLLEAVRTSAAGARAVLFTSSDVYGAVKPEDLPITEDSPLAPLNPYAASKAACHHMGRQYHLNFSLDLVEIRPFNMIGPRQKPGFVLPDWAQQVARIKRGNAEPVLNVGRLTDERDFVDVRDAVVAMADVTEGGMPGTVYHVCSGTGTRVERLLDLLLEASGGGIEVRQDPARLRPARTPVFYGSAERIRALSGWQPRISLEQSVRDTLDYWLEHS
jgi:GDP-4-dehydro-6-deoxy-D-mannose reductase